MAARLVVAVSNSPKPISCLVSLGFAEYKSTVPFKLEKAGILVALNIDADEHAYLPETNKPMLEIS